MAITRGRHDKVFFAEELLGITPHDGQKQFLTQSTYKTNVLVPANRYGKTTTIAIKHIHACFYKLGVPEGNHKAWIGDAYKTAALAPSSQQSKVVLQTIRQILTSSFPIRLGNKLVSNKCQIEWFLEECTETPPMQIKYCFGSKTVVRSTETDKAKSIAADAFGYISYDEAGKSLHLEEELETTLYPRLGDYSGQIDLVGTPDASSPSFVFFQEVFWKGGGEDNPVQEGYYSQEGSALDNPYLPEGYVKEMKQIYGKSPLLDQVLYGKFVSVGNKVFDHRTVLHAAKDIEDYIPFIDNHKYIIGVDTAIGEDEMVYTVLDWTEKPLKVCRISACKGNSQSPAFHLQNIMDIFDHYNQGEQCNIILETFNGESMRFYYDLPRKMQLKTRCFGSGRVIGVTKKAGMVDRKEDILIAARKVLDNEEVEFSSKFRTLIQQLSNYTLDDEKIKTDWVISFCLAVFYATDGQPKTTTVEMIAVDW